MLKKRRLHFKRIAIAIKKQRAQAGAPDAVDSEPKPRRVSNAAFLARFNAIQKMQQAGKHHWAHGAI